MADNRRQDDSDDYGEREVKTGHIYEDADEEAGLYQEGEEELEYQDELDYEDAVYPDDDPERETEEGFPLDKMKEVIMALQIGLKKKDIELLQSKQQNLELLHELEKLSEQYVKDQSKEADQLSRVKQYEEEFQQIQKVMQDKLAMVGDVHSKLKDLETEKHEMGKSLKESAQINQQLKGILEQKDKVIEKMQTEMEKFIAIKNEVTPIFKEAGEMKKALLERNQEVELLKEELAQATKIVNELPNIEQYVKQASDAIKTMGAENETLKVQISEVTKENEELKIGQEELQTGLNNFASKDEELKKLFDMFEKALKSLTEENNDLKERMTELNKENEDLKNITERFKDEFKSLRDQNLLLTEENSKLATALKTAQTQFKQSHSESRQSATTTDSGIKGHKQLAERVKKSSSHIKKKDIIVEARDSSEERSDSVRDITPDESQEEYMFKRNKLKTGSKRSEISSRQSQNAENLRASNHLLQQQNEALRIKTMLMEERSKMEHDDLNKTMLQNITKAINELKVSSKTKKAISDSEDSEEEKVKKKKKPKTSTKKTEKQKPAKQLSEERQTHLENFLCGQIEKLNVELNREREWRDQVLQSSHRRTSGTPKHIPAINPIESSSFAAFLRAANPSSVAYKAEAEVSELNKVERSMQSAFSDFETKLKAVHSKITWS